VKYGGMSEEDAWKMVTLNPAKLLHLDDRMGSVKVGKDADLVLWTNHPLSIQAQTSMTMIDGVIYFDRARDVEMEVKNQQDKARIISNPIRKVSRHRHSRIQKTNTFTVIRSVKKVQPKKTPIDHEKTTSFHFKLLSSDFRTLVGTETHTSPQWFSSHRN
jgi:adenine deaminase